MTVPTIIDDILIYPWDKIDHYNKQFSDYTIDTDSLCKYIIEEVLKFRKVSGIKSFKDFFSSDISTITITAVVNVTDRLGTHLRTQDYTFLMDYHVIMAIIRDKKISSILEINCDKD